MLRQKRETTKKQSVQKRKQNNAMPISKSENEKRFCGHSFETHKIFVTPVLCRESTESNLNWLTDQCFSMQKAFQLPQLTFISGNFQVPRLSSQ